MSRYDESKDLVSCVYKELYGETRPSFMRNDDGTLTVLRVESIKKNLGIGIQNRGSQQSARAETL